MPLSTYSNTGSQLKRSKNFLSPEQEKRLNIAMKEKKQEKGFRGTAQEMMEWLQN